MTGTDDDPARSFKEFQNLTDRFFRRAVHRELYRYAARYPSMGVEAAPFAGLDPLLAIKEELQRLGSTPLLAALMKQLNLSVTAKAPGLRAFQRHGGWVLADAIYETISISADRVDNLLKAHA